MDSRLRGNDEASEYIRNDGQYAFEKINGRSI